ncbi:hypothetical protein M427DRAFT_132586 [Gonapodya prolifera JEL478]|uniref:L domain-like protein n=1 Tax=Gonapodya prolifera (strain JEL478) TaxID=1344416 RepID=A0A139APR5_GONPJ|nr:hypothetical protein M427DRAFT_132586 [Gonapodya prolifera JEL478]|eukprot:KXS18644.1 hypothetical protein M427DRAFT_132586 [Gonapodya prolifera JEL478]
MSVQSEECGVVSEWIESSGLSVPWENNMCCMEGNKFGMWAFGAEADSTISILCKHAYEGYRIVWIEMDGKHEQTHKLGDIPAELAAMSKLQVLHVPNNNIVNIGHALSSLHRLTSVDLSGNPLMPGMFFDGIFSVRADLTTCDLIAKDGELFYCDEADVPDACLETKANGLTKGDCTILESFERKSEAAVKVQRRHNKPPQSSYHNTHTKTIAAGPPKSTTSTKTAPTAAVSCAQKWCRKTFRDDWTVDRCVKAASAHYGPFHDWEHYPGQRC